MYYACLKVIVYLVILQISDEALVNQAFTAFKERKDSDVRIENETILIRYRDQDYSCHVFKASKVENVLRKELMDLLEDNMREL